MSKQDEADAQIAKCVVGDGGFLDALDAHQDDIDYLFWPPDRDTATLDGQFTLEQLRAIANHMEKHGGGK